MLFLYDCVMNDIYFNNRMTAQDRRLKFQGPQERKAHQDIRGDRIRNTENIIKKSKKARFPFVM